MPVHHQITDGVCVITIDNPPVNVLGLAVRSGLMAALDAAEVAGVRRIVLTGAGKAFVAGADAREFDTPPVAPHLPDILRRLERLPVIAAINGAALGGGLELALAARVRIAHPNATVGLPEVTLGVVPGAGGTQRLPRLVGTAAAVVLISEGRVIGATEALEVGVVDFLADDPLATAVSLSDQAIERHPLVADRPAPDATPNAIEVARRQVSKRSPGQVAPQCAIDLVEAASRLPFAEGLALERATYLELRQSAQSAALRHVFFAERAALSRNRDLPAPTEIARAVVVGGGTMGAAIAYALAGIGIHVTTVETGEDAATRARANIAGLYADAVQRGKATAGQADTAQTARHDVRVGYDALPAADIAIEAAFEDLTVKRQIFAALDKALPNTAILATNTSYLDVNAIFDGLRNPERLLGLHFFAPAHVMKLLEVIRATRTSPRTLSTAFHLAQKLKKIPVEAGVCDGFIGNRILTRYRQATDILLMEGALPWQIDAALEGFGMAMGPYAVQDLSGLDIAYANRQRKARGQQGGIRHLTVADRMVEELKRLGRKSGAGWYDYPDGQPRQPSATVRALIENASSATGIPRKAIPDDTIRDRAVLAMIEEGLHILGEGIARRPADIDLVLVHGYGFPRWRGGPMHHADRTGLPAILARLTALAAEDPLSWRVPDLLTTLVARDKPLASLN
jgi:3-hydroxyacyl-CoA dehydrogenase